MNQDNSKITFTYFSSFTRPKLCVWYYGSFCGYGLKKKYFIKSTFG